MITRRSLSTLVLAAVILILSFASLLIRAAQERPPQPPAAARGAVPQVPPVVSPEVLPDRRVTFRILAPQAEAVRLQGGDIPALAGGRGGPGGIQMTKGENGIWEATLGPLEPGAYRYNFSVQGISVIDPRNPSTSESNNNTWSLVVVPGSEWMDAGTVPHGAVGSVHYYSTALKRMRRMHIYTPPGYEAGKEKYPVFYLLHGAGDCDDSWTSVGRAGFIMDNLIAARKARPMLVVMPAGHTSSSMFGARGAAPAATGASAAPPRDEFSEDFLTDIMPYVEKNYRVLTGRPNRAIAGLSMGGSQTLNISFSRLDSFSYIGVFSSGILGGGRGARAATPPAAAAPAAPAAAAPPPSAAWEEQRLAVLDDVRLKKGLKLIWFSTGVDDFLIANSRSTVEMLRKHGFQVEFKESPGAHTWLNWRSYLIEFAPQLFR
jgi:enterochelin esterase-like enzyme